MLEKPAFIQGLFAWQGDGLDKPRKLGAASTYQVPADRRAQTVYLRAGNSCSEMIYLILTAGGKTMRLFPVGAKAAIHVPLAVLEDLPPTTKVEILLAAPAGLAGSLVLDVGLMEIE